MKDVSRRFTAYDSAWYRFRVGRRLIEIRVGKPCPEVDELLRRHGLRRWGFVTACDPGPERLTSAENRMRTRRLEAELSRKGYVFFRGAGGSDTDNHEEASFLVLGMSLRDAERLRRRYAQDCIVAGQAGQVARLSPRGPDR